jgi:hypothetical protein
MSVGKPVFLSGSTSLPEIGGKHAFYFKNFESDQMQSDFVRGMKKYKKFSMQENIKDHSRSFSWDQAAREYLKFMRAWPFNNCIEFLFEIVKHENLQEAIKIYRKL